MNWEPEYFLIVGLDDAAVIPMRTCIADPDNHVYSFTATYYAELSEDDVHSWNLDDDRQDDVDEIPAGTDPTDPSSVFAITNITRGSVTVEWNSVTGKQYVVYYSDEEFGDSMS